MCRVLFFFLMTGRPPKSTLFPPRRSSVLRPLGPPSRYPQEPRPPGRVARFLRQRGAAAPAGRRPVRRRRGAVARDRKSTRLNSSHANISYAVFCLKKKNNNHDLTSLTDTK